MIESPGKTFWRLILYPVALWLWLAWSCAGEWLRNPDYQYGLLMLPLAIYFLLKRAPTFSFREDKYPQLPLAWCILFLTALSIFAVELFRLSPLYWRLLLWLIGLLATLASFSAASILGGRSLMRAIAFPVLFLLLAIPWPTFLEQRTTFPLMNAVADIVGQTVLFLGMPAQVFGTTITLPNCTIGIEEACSGLRSFQTALVLGLAAGELYFLSVKRRIALLFFAAFFAFFENIARTFFLTWEGIKGGKAQIEYWHDPAAWIFLLLLAGAIFLLAILLRDHPLATDSSVRREYPSPSSLRVNILWSLGLCAFLLAQGWYLVRGGWQSHEVQRIVTERASQASGLETITVPPEVMAILAPTEGKYFRAQSETGIPLSAYHFYWAPSRTTAFQVYHRPDICMPGAGWKQAGDVTRMNIDSDGFSQPWYVFPYERNNVRAFLLWGAWLDGSPVEFQFNRKMAIQQNASLHFIANGKRKVSYEVAALLIPYDGPTLPENLAKEAVRLFFTENENSSGR
ncbi:MAG: exosortase/archaeosortase family protein [Chthoniobacterales bacterium]